MEPGQDGDGKPTEWRSVMIDLSGVSLTDLVTDDDESVLAHSLRRVLGELSGPGEPIAGFNSAV
ncbi:MULTISPECIES: FxSxx-COOH cyclophane-containing RiPP peptide [Actinoplanes]|uniref:FxSxx-COOH cyclophane-containing RiPP peptide n=1 Tax=Actinoplanes TaxID=1865 RepID=UPI000B012A73|nr:MULTISPECIES: FxSxx-COOH cyclophane-containing RiPP peptide [Actinoplanes]GLY01223.1 hypothetical protein Acsp01_16020 [Actinoplanes sp. NBRC 101535]